MTEFKVLKDVPTNMGHGEGGRTLPELYGVLKQIDSKLQEIDQRLNELEKTEGE